MYCGDEVSAVVGDIGTTHARFGFAGEDTPKAFLPSKAGYQADQGVASASPGKGDAAAAAAATATANGAWSITDSELACRRDGLSIRPAVTGGVFSDWEVVEKLWTRAFEWLNVTNEHTVLSAESPWSTSAHRQQMMELMFETYNVPGLFIAKSSALAAFSVGRSTSMVVDCGGGGTSVVPVLDGYVLNKPIQRSHRGGEWLTEQVHNFLGKQSITVHPRYAVNRKRTRDGTLASDLAAFPKTHPSYVQRCRLEAVQGLKEAVCGLPLVRFSNQDLAAHLPVPGMPSTYELPDGTPINLSPELFRVPEMLFDDDEHRSEQGPEKGTASSSSVAAGSAVAAASAAVPSSSSSQSPATPAGPHVALQKMVHKSLSLCDVDVRKELAGSILLTGGGAQFKYMPERLQREVTALVPSSYKVRVIAPSNIERRFGVWIGGSIVSSLGSFQQMWLSKTEYHELGRVLAEQRFTG